MNDLKFRVWDKEKNKFLKSNDYLEKEPGLFLLDFNGKIRYALFPQGNGDNAADSVFELVNNQDRFEIQQYTGCDDKSGKPVYEGDIIKHISFGTWQIGTVRFFAGAFFVEWENQHDDVIGYLLTSGIEVIGNIFEYKK